MSSTYSDRLKLELMATGANANTWGTNTNNNLEVLDALQQDIYQNLLPDHLILHLLLLMHQILQSLQTKQLN